MGNFAFPNLASPSQAASPAVTSTARGQLVMMGEEITVTAAQLTLNALFGSIKVPKGAVIKDVTLMSTDIDTNGSPTVTLSIGDAGDDDRLMTANTVGQAGGVSSTPVSTGFAYQYTAETLVQIKVKAIPATAAAGTLTYQVTYVSP